MEYKTEGKETPSLTDWLIRTGLGQFEARLRQIGIKDVSSFAELDADDLNEMQINDMKCHLAQVLMSVAQYVNEKSKIVPNKQPPLFIRQDSMEPTSFSEHTDKISIAFVGSSSSGKTNLSVQFISGKFMLCMYTIMLCMYTVCGKILKVEFFRNSVSGAEFDQ